MDRHIPLEGVDNFRDFGGYSGHGGRRLRTGKLYRSASHGRASEADLEAINALPISVIVDLRRLSERERDPSRRHAAFAGEVIINDHGEDEEDSWIAHVSTSDLSQASFRDYMLRYYREAPFNPRLTTLFRRYFETLATADGAVLIHCAAGKDRTGILAALVHHLMGVGREEMMADYLLTNDPERLERRAPMITAVIRELSGRTPSRQAVQAAMRVEAEYLDEAFAAMAGRHGDVDGYLEAAVGLSPERRRRLEERLLEEA